MEPRPQQPRQPSGPRNQPPGGQPPAGGQAPQQQPTPPQATPEQQGYPEGVDTQAFIAPPRTDYDYSPLDLAPPGQRRRRQFIAAAIGALSVLLVGALLAFGWTLLRDDDSSDNNNLAAVATQTPSGADAAAGTPEATAAPTEAAVEDGAPTEPPAEAAAPTQPAEGPVVATDAASLSALLPTQDMLPPGFEAGVDSSRTQEEVVAALGGGRPAEQNLENWGWTANVERAFTNPAPEAGATSPITVSLHGFQDAASAAEALPFFADILLNIGYSDIAAPAIGESARLLTQPLEEGGVNVALYVQDGPILYRFGGFAIGGDPTQDVINVATQMLGGQ